MRVRVIAPTVLLGMASVFAQGIVRPSDLPPKLRDFSLNRGAHTLKCEIRPFKPRVDFGFRFQAGYIVSIPLKQYEPGKHAWGILTRVTPETGEPVFLLSSMKPHPFPKTNGVLELSGSYLLGEGRYETDWIVVDEQGRTCSKSWSAEAKLGRGERRIDLRIPPNAVWSLASLRGTGTNRNESAASGKRFTIMLHAAPLFPRATRLRGYDRALLLGSLAALIERLPAKSIRLVVFNLDQQKELFRQDAFEGKDLDKVDQAIGSVELGQVDYRVLQNRGGHVELLARLINKEVESELRSDAVIFLGPPARYMDKLPASMIEERTGAPQFFGFQHRSLFFRRGGELPDSIQLAIKTMKGRTKMIHTPGEFAAAIHDMESRLTSDPSAEP